MENHPIPQDVTGFKFRLIGSITLKQFLYLLFAGIFTYICLILGLPFFVKLTLSLVPAILGLSLAFLPIDGRPMDQMILNYIKAIPSENQYIYRKTGSNLLDFTYFEYHKKTTNPNTKTDNINHKTQELQKMMYFKQTQDNYPAVTDEELSFLKKVKSFFDEAAIEKIDLNEEESKKLSRGNLNVSSKPQKVDSKIKEEEKKTEQAGATSEEIDKANKQVREKERFDKAVIEEAKRERAKSALEILERTPSAKTLTEDTSLSAGFPILPDIPNVVLGIVKDPRGKVLQNVLVEILDKNDVPVRAFKTNSLGQFMAATPLSDGIYKIFLDDPQKKHEFQAVQINLKSEIFYPLEITSVDDREKLRRELFKN